MFSVSSPSLYEPNWTTDTTSTASTAGKTLDRTASEIMHAETWWNELIYAATPLEILELYMYMRIRSAVDSIESHPQQLVFL